MARARNHASSMEEEYGWAVVWALPVQRLVDVTFQREGLPRSVDDSVFGQHDDRSDQMT